RRLNKKSEEPSQGPGTTVPTQVPTLVASATPVTGGSSHKLFIFGASESPTINVAGKTRQLAVPRRRLNKKSEEPSQGPGTTVPTQVPTLVVSATPVTGGSSRQPSIYGASESPTINVAGKTRQLAGPRRRLNKKSGEPSQGPGTAVPTQVPTLVASATPVTGGSSHQPSIFVFGASELPTINGQTRQLAVPRIRLNKKSEEPSQGPGMTVPTQVTTLVASATPVTGGSSNQDSIFGASESPFINVAGKTRQLAVPRRRLNKKLQKLSQG
ncbi:hypothetical protein AB205_0209740, partial [Aquarana catesbeiana]